MNLESSFLDRALRALLLMLLAVTAYYVVLHADVLRIDHPITQDEPGFIEITRGGNSYTFAQTAANGSVYGPVYRLWARPFTALIANPYIAHRWASSIALFIALGLLGAVLRREGVGGMETTAGLAIVYILNVSSHSLAASTDFLGMMFYLATLAAARRGTWPALLLSLGLAVLGTLTKPYFALGGVIVASHLVLFAPPRRSLAFLGVSAVVALGVIGILHLVAPFYFLSTFLLQASASLRSASTLVHQTADFCLLAGGVLLLALLARPRRRRFLIASSTPPISPPLEIWTWAALVSAGALLLSLGWNFGNYLVYYYHLLLGPLVVVALGRLRDWPRLGRALVAANLLVLGVLLPPLPRDDHWSALAADVARIHGPILADPLLEPFTRSQGNVELIAHGQSASILLVLDSFGGTLPAAYIPLHQEMLRRVDALGERVRARSFDAIYLSYGEVGPGSAWNYENGHIMDAVRANYRPVAQITVFPYGAPYWDRLRHGEYPYHVTRWERREGSASPASHRSDGG